MLSRPDLGVPPYLGYTGSVLDRAADRRTDAAAIAAFEADPRARIHLVGGELVALRKSAEIVGTPAPNGGDDPAFTFAEAGALAPWRERVFLGLRDGAPRFAAGIDKEAAEALKNCNEARTYLGLVKQKYPKSNVLKQSDDLDKQIKKDLKNKAKCSPS